MIVINDRISYIEATEDPLSADIGIISDGDGCIWLYDVGNGAESIKKLKGKYRIVLSHFHSDHTGNIDNVDAEELYVSNETFKHVHKGTVVTGDIYAGDMHIFPLLSCHCKGSLGLEVGGKYAFVGDGTYCKVKDGYYIYNPQLLQEEIRVLSELSAPYLLVSHLKGLVRKKEEVLEELKEIYSLREKGSPEIRIPIE